MTIEVGRQAGDGFKPTLTSGLVALTSGASGDIVTLTPPSGEAVRLTALTMPSASTEGNISIRVAGVDSVTNKILAGTNANLADNFMISTGVSAGNSNDQLSSVFPPIVGGIDEVITIVKTSGTTANTINYGYQFGEIS